MRSWSRLIGVGLLVVAASGCWPAPGGGPDRRSWNRFERELTPETVPALVEAFRVPLADGAGPPIVTDAGLFVRSGVSIGAFDRTTGAARWTVPVAPDPELYVASDPHLSDSTGEVLATATRLDTRTTEQATLVTIDAVTGSAERRLVQGALTSLRDRSMALVRREALRPDVDVTYLELVDLDAGTLWGGIAVEATGGTGSLGSRILYVATRDEVQAYDTHVSCQPAYPEQDPLVCPSRWSRTVMGTPTPAVIGGDTVYSASSNGWLFALDADAGGVRWIATIGSAAVPPALAGDVLFAPTTDGRLHAVPAGGCGAYFCGSSWTTGPGASIDVQPAVAGGVVYVGSSDGTVRAFDASGCGTGTCEPIWSADAGAPVTGGLAVVLGRLYVGTSGGVVAYGLRPA